MYEKRQTLLQNHGSRGRVGCNLLNVRLSRCCGRPRRLFVRRPHRKHPRRRNLRMRLQRLDGCRMKEPLIRKTAKQDTLKAASRNALWFTGPEDKRVKLAQALANGSRQELRSAARKSLSGITCTKARKRLEIALQGL